MKHHTEPDYTHESLLKEREYGVYWYSWLWNIIRPALIFVCSIVLLIGGLSYAWGQISGVLIDPVDESDQSKVVFVVKSGDSLSRVATNLKNFDLVRNRSVFKYYADFMGFGQKIQAGEYTLSRSMTIGGLAEQLTRGDGKPLVRNITIIPGWTVENIADYLLNEKVIQDKEAFLSKCRGGEAFSAFYYIADVLEKGNPQNRKYALEGYLAPDTYEVYTDADQDSIIKKLLSQTEAVFKEPYHARAEELGLSMDEALTLASLIEKEAKTADFARVSAVFHGRLRQNMLLGSDVTVKYISGTSRMALTGDDLALQSPFNTYRAKGLPPGPICSPSAAAIQAALYPDEQFLTEGYLYFCSKDPSTGELYFSKTLAEHEYAVSVYKPLWDAYDKRTNAQ